MFNQMETVSRSIDDGMHLIGVSVTMDKAGYVTWVNFMLWPESKQLI